jgi:hypothetical protein
MAMAFEEMNVPLEIQKLAIESMRGREAVAVLSVTSCHHGSCAAQAVEDVARVRPGTEPT